MPRISARHAMTPAANSPDRAKCRLCTCALDHDEDDDFELRICGNCKDRPEARRLGIGLAPLQPRRPHVVGLPTAARDFTPAEKALIARVHAFMPATQLLELLNERLICDLGLDAARYTMDLLQREIGQASPAAPGGDLDWAGLRKLLAQARRSGVLAKVNEQVIDDFAVVWSLNPKQVMSLKDVLLRDEESAS